MWKTQGSGLFRFAYRGSFGAYRCIVPALDQGPILAASAGSGDKRVFFLAGGFGACGGTESDFPARSRFGCPSGLRGGFIGFRGRLRPC